VLLALFQAYGIAVALRRRRAWSRSRLVLPRNDRDHAAGGTMFLMWLGEQITSRGIGNGISLIIFAGIVASMPRALPADAGTWPHGRLNFFRVHHAVVVIAVGVIA
jgi:preprotein translocase subunit SecY